MAFPTATLEIDFADDPTATYYETTLALGPTAYYRMNDAGSLGSTIVDWSGNGNDAVVGGGTWGQSGGLLPGDPTDGSLFGAAPVFALAARLASHALTPGAYTFECWFNGTSGGDIIAIGGVGGVVRFQAGNPGLIRVLGPGAVPFVTYNLTMDANPHHFVYVASQSKMYYDGQLIAIGGSDGTNWSGSSPAFQLGGFNGILDEVAFYDRSLSNTEVVEHYYSAFTNVAPPQTDVTSFFISGATKRGRQQERDQPEAGTGTVVFDDTDSRFEPTNTAGPYYGTLLPLRRIRQTWTYNGIDYRRFAGFVASYPLVWERPSESRAELELIDGFEQLQQADISGRSWSAELAGARINHVLDACLWPRSLRRIDTGYATVQATAFDASSGQAGLAHIQDVCDTDLGYFFISGDGYATFHDRWHRQTAARSKTSRAVFGEDGDTLPYEEIEFEYTKDRILNDVTTTCSSGTAQKAGDARSLARYFPRSLSRSTINTTDADSLTQSQILVSRYKDPLLRITRMRLAPATIGGTVGDALWARVLDAEIGDRFTVIATPPGGGAQVAVDVFLEQIADEYAGDVQWSTTWQLSPAGSPVYGLTQIAARFPQLIQQPLLPAMLPTLISR